MSITPKALSPITAQVNPLKTDGEALVRELSGEPESMVFALPKELRVQLVD